MFLRVHLGHWVETICKEKLRWDSGKEGAVAVWEAVGLWKRF